MITEVDSKETYEDLSIGISFCFLLKIRRQRTNMI